MGIHQRIVQLNHYVCRQLAMESPHDTNRLRYITSDLIYMVLNSKISYCVRPRNLTVETFISIVSRILTANEFFWLKIIIYEVLLTFRESLLVLSHLSTPTSSQFTEAWTLLTSLSDAKTLYHQQNEQSASGLRSYGCHWCTKEKVLGPTPTNT